MNGAEAAPPTPRSDEPGPDVVIVYDRDGEPWFRHRGGWIYIDTKTAEIRPWEALNGRWGPITTTAGTTPPETKGTDRG
ncbi:hypothetical protein ACIBTV_27450 [Micromonospora sp. NPDC049366]|uniref:hypothetical protein n=1 Tax=Micromonospora sp. NPDC049366 TaxID=3364271 RepID=UPI0037969EA2